jgi:uracil-DNA glycosylase
LQSLSLLSPRVAIGKDMTTQTTLLRRIYSDYSSSVGLNPRATYLHGTPLRPVVPLDTAVGGVFFLGAYPSARFAVVSGVSDVPVADNLGPFENERWFDGSRVRVQPSARELTDYFLSPLELAREDCWITDLVKVFLFKPGHARRYEQLGRAVPTGYVREDFYELGLRSLPWVENELQAAKPRLLITLGAEVAGVVAGHRGTASQVRLLIPEVREARIGQTRVPTIHCPHPGVLMRGNVTQWPIRHRKEFLPAIQMYLKPTSRPG